MTSQPTWTVRGTPWTARRWRKTQRKPPIFMTGDKFQGAAVWEWDPGRFRIQCWTYPRSRLVTFRNPRPLAKAKRLAERWLAARASRKEGT